MEEVINIDNKIDTDNSHEYRGDHYCNYLVVFCSKYKRSLFVDDIAENLSSIFHKIALKNGFIISKLDIFPSYCELIIQCDPELGITECIKN